MEAPEHSSEEEYSDMQLHAPAFANIVKFLPGNEALKVRLLNHFWDHVVTDSLQHQDQTELTRLKVDLTWLEDLKFFMTEFPEAATPTGLHQFTNFHLNAIETPIALCNQFGGIHGPWLRFVTLDIYRPLPAGYPFTSPPPENFYLAKLLLNHCPRIEKLRFKGNINHGHFPSLAVPVTELGTLFNLVELETQRIWAPAFDEFLQEILSKAPNVCRISIAISMREDPIFLIENQQTLAPYLRHFERLTFANLELRLVHETIFKELAGMDINVIRSLSIGTTGWSDTLQNVDMEAFASWLGRQVDLQSFLLARGNSTGRNAILPFQLPPVTNIWALELDNVSMTPIRPSQVPSLEKVTLTTSGDENPFNPEKEFPKVTWLSLSLIHGQTGWGLPFSNLETLQLVVASGTMDVMKSYLAQFPTLARLIFNFDPKCSSKMQRDAWWDFFTGGIRPIMRRSTSVEDLQTRTPPIPDQEGNPGTVAAEPLPLQLLPCLKILELNNTPEIVAFAIIILSAIGIAPHLDVLRMNLNEDACENEVQNFIEVLKQHHQAIEISGFTRLRSGQLVNTLPSLF